MRNFTARIGAPPIITWSSIAAGVVLLVVSYVLDRRQSAWLASTITNIASSLLLFAPLYWLTKRLDTRVTATEDATREGLAHLDSRVAEVKEETAATGLRLDALRASLDERLDLFREAAAREERTQHEQTELLLARVASAPTREEFEDFLREAIDEGWFSLTHPPRVVIGVDDAKLGVRLTEKSGQLTDWSFVLMTPKDEHFAEVRWPQGDDFAAIAKTVKETAEPLLGHPRLSGDDLALWLGRLADLAQLAIRQPTLRPLIQAFGHEWTPASDSEWLEILHEDDEAMQPSLGWVINDRGVNTERDTYLIGSDRVHEDDWKDHLRQKPWVDDLGPLGNALDTARRIWPSEAQ